MEELSAISDQLEAKKRKENERCRKMILRWLAILTM